MIRVSAISHPDLLERHQVGVLHGVMQEAGDEGLVVHAELRQDACHLDGVRDVRLSGLAILPAVRVVRQRQRLPHLTRSQGVQCIAVWKEVQHRKGTATLQRAKRQARTTTIYARQYCWASSRAWTLTEFTGSNYHTQVHMPKRGKRWCQKKHLLALMRRQVVEEGL